MLVRAKENLPDVVSKAERFELPKVRGYVEGIKTIIVNFLFALCCAIFKGIDFSASLSQN